MRFTSRESALVSLVLFAALVGAIPTLAIASDSKDEEQKISFDQLPEQVQKAVKLATKGGKIEKVERETENGKTLYEIAVEVKGGEIEMLYNDQGILVGIEVEEADEDEEHEKSAKHDDDDDEDEKDDKEEVVAKVKFEDIPSAARDAIKAKAEGTAITEVEAITEDDVTVYEAAWMDKDVKQEVTVTKSGEVLSFEASLNADQLPKGLQDLAKKFGSGHKLKAERKTIVVYELEFEDDGKEVELYADAAGRVVEIDIVDRDDADDHEEHHDKD